jgi:hypothetical protein
MRLRFAFIALWISGSACANGLLPPDQVTDPSTVGILPNASQADIETEVARVRAALVREVPRLIIDSADSEQKWIAGSKAALVVAGRTVETPQLLVVVNRNPAVQQMRIILAVPGGRWQSLGGSNVSTGQANRRGYFLTPTGVFQHTDAIVDWRAEGTYNEEHIRGLGLKGMRVWDFGWQRAKAGWGEGDELDIRLLMHATDPNYLERRLGQTASKGCVRIAGSMNVFLDRHGVLDADVERAAKTDSRYEDLLLPVRTPTALAGNTMIVIDSAAIR